MLCTLLVTAGCASRLPNPPSRAAASLAGTSWRLVGIRDRGRPVVPWAHPRLDFFRDGSIGLDDTVNGLGGHYRPDGNGLTIRQGSTTLVAYAGTDHRRLTTIAAVDSVVFRFSRGTSAPSTHVAIARTGTSLRITSQHYELQYRAAGAVPDEPSAPSRTSR